MLIFLFLANFPVKEILPNEKRLIKLKDLQFLQFFIFILIQDGKIDVECLKINYFIKFFFIFFLRLFL